jgi:alpha-beta hydrolase superfamily lysophospholipase
MSQFEFGWKTTDNVQLYAQGWQPDSPQAVIALVHGLGEHCGRYAHLAAFLNQAGYAVLAFDLRGHGKSEGARGYVASYAAVMDDIAHLLAEASQRYPNRPCFLYGHSLGGNLVLNYALRRRPKLTGVVSTSPALKTAFEPPAWKVTAAKVLCNVLPGLTMPNGLELAALSRDPQVIQAYSNDPLVHDKLSTRLGWDTLQNGLWALEHASEFPLPLLLVHGEADRITSAQASREFAAKAGKCCTLKIWPGLYHETHNEPEKDQVFAYLLEWLKKTA